MLVNAIEMLYAAKKEKYSVPQFNINNLEWTKSVLEMCQEIKSPVILGVSEGAAKYMGGYFSVFCLVYGLIKNMNISIPVVLHLDHGKSVDACKKAIDAGFTSVMIDGSSFEINKNIEMVNEVVSYAHPKGVSVEAEIGHIGGSEESVNQDIAYATLEDCILIVEKTNLDFLAPALGSVHGLYNGEAKIDLGRMEKIREKVNIPLVLHGGTGISDEIIKNSIRSGVCKININTELQIVWAKEVKNFLDENSDEYDPRKIIGSGLEKMKEAIKEKIVLFGSGNKA